MQDARFPSSTVGPLIFGSSQILAHPQPRASAEGASKSWTSEADSPGSMVVVSRKGGCSIAGSLFELPSISLVDQKDMNPI